MACLTIAMFLRMLSHIKSAWELGRGDLELRDFHAFLAASMLSFFILIYTAFDLCTAYFWIYTGIGLVMDRLTRNVRKNAAPSNTTQQIEPSGVGTYYQDPLVQKY